MVKTDKEGKFSLPARYTKTLVAINEEGFVEARLENLDTNLTLTLQPWGTIEGIVRNSRKPAANQLVMVAPARGGAGTRLNFDFEA